MASITKILFRQGSNLVRKVQNIIFSTGEPAFTVDTKRLYIGDGVTIGGIPAGVKNWGTFTPVFSSQSPLSYDASMSTTISAVEAGDLIYDAQNLSLYFALTSAPLPSQWVKYNFGSFTLSGYNGVSVTSMTGAVSAQLDPSIFTVSPSNQSVSISYDVLLGGSKRITTGGDIRSGGNIVATSIVSAFGGNSTIWNSNFTTVNASSADWTNISTTVKNTSANWATPPHYYRSTIIGYTTQTYYGLSSFNPANPLPGGDGRVIGKYISLSGDIVAEGTAHSSGQMTSYTVFVSTNQAVVSIPCAAYTQSYFRWFVGNNRWVPANDSNLGNWNTFTISLSPAGIHQVSFVHASDGTPPNSFNLTEWYNSANVVYVSAGPPK
jgi:hypothetical protein